MNLKKIKKYLKKGDITKIAEKAGVSRAMAYQVLNEEKNNDTVIDEAIALAKQRKSENENRIKEIESL